jgi:hypothetical protein
VRFHLLGPHRLRLAPCSRTPRVGSGKGVAGTCAKLRPPGPRGTRLTPWSRWPRAGSRAGVAGVGADPSEGFPRPRAGSRAGVAKTGAYPLEGVPRPGSFRLVVGGIVSCCCLVGVSFLVVVCGGIVSCCCLWGHRFLLLSLGGIVSCCCLVGVLFLVVVCGGRWGRERAPSSWVVPGTGGWLGGRVPGPGDE